MHGIPSAEWASGDEVACRSQGVCVERMPGDEAIQQAELINRAPAVSAPHPVVEELLAALDAHVQTEITNAGGLKNLSAGGSARVLTTNREEKDRGVNEDRSH